MYLWLGPQSEEVLLAMRIRPFLSHKREDHHEVALLREMLKLYGAGGYKDTEDLRLGANTADELRLAIHERTGGFIWWGTQNALGSAFINEHEIPNAIERAKAKPPYPIVPLFVDLKPGADAAIMRAALRSHTDDFLAHNGVVFDGTDLDAFRVQVARRYVRDAIAGLGVSPMTIAFRTLSEPDGAHDLTFDWRGLVDARRRVLVSGALESMTDVLANARDAVQETTSSPELHIDPDLPLPLAFLVGYEWRITTRLRLAVHQRTGSTFRWISADGTAPVIAAPAVTKLGTNGPAVIVISCGSEVPGAAGRYADSVGARHLITLHIDGLLDDDRIRGLARAAAGELRAANDRGDDKHLLIVGPATLAVLIGAAANASGPVVVPFWDGTAYVSPVVIG